MTTEMNVRKILLSLPQRGVRHAHNAQAGLISFQGWRKKVMLYATHCHVQTGQEIVIIVCKSRFARSSIMLRTS